MGISYQLKQPDIVYVFSKKYMKERIRTMLLNEFNTGDTVRLQANKHNNLTRKFNGINYKFDLEDGEIEHHFVLNHKAKNSIANIFSMFDDKRDIKFESNHLAFRKIDKNDLVNYLLGDLTPVNRKKFKLYFLTYTSIDFPFDAYIGNEKLSVETAYAKHVVQDCPLEPELIHQKDTTTNHEAYHLKFDTFFGRVCMSLTAEALKNFREKYPTKKDIKAELKKRYHEQTYLNDNDTIVLGLLLASNIDYATYDGDIHFPHTILSFRLAGYKKVKILPSLVKDSSSENSLNNINDIKFSFNFFRDNYRALGAYYVACNDNTLPDALPDPEAILGENAHCTMVVSKSILTNFFREQLRMYFGLELVGDKTETFFLKRKIRFKDNTILKFKDYFKEEVKLIVGRIKNDYEDSFFDFAMSIPVDDSYSNLTYKVKPFIYERSKKKNIILFSFVRSDLKTDFGHGTAFVNAFYKSLKSIFIEDKKAEKEISEDQLENLMQLELHRKVPEGLYFGKDIIPEKYYFKNENLVIDFVKKGKPNQSE